MSDRTITRSYDKSPIYNRLVAEIMDELDARVERYAEALRECARLSGVDLSDGFPTWPELPDFAVQEVKRLREDYDEACEEASQSWK